MKILLLSCILFALQPLSNATAQNNINNQSKKDTIMKFELPALPYAISALEDKMSQRTLEFHWGKHHAAYVNNLNNLIPGTEFENMTLEQIICAAQGPIFNNAAQVWNHTFFFYELSPTPQSAPSGKLLEAINRDFGSFDLFRESFNKAGASLFGSGWVWLVKNKDNKLEIVAMPNAGNPLRDGLKPIMTADVWEHAYYLDYQNRRPDFLKAFWELLDWKVVEQRFDQ